MAPELIRSESDMRPSAMLMPSQMTGPVKTMRLNNVTVAAATGLPARHNPPRPPERAKLG